MHGLGAASVRYGEDLEFVGADSMTHFDTEFRASTDFAGCLRLLRGTSGASFLMNVGACFDSGAWGFAFRTWSNCAQTDGALCLIISSLM